MKTNSPGTVLSASAGVPFDLTLTARDPYGNVATSYLGTVHFSSSDPLAQLPTDYTFTRADRGLHIFQVLLKTCGQHTITITDALSGSLTGAWVVMVR